MLQEDADIVSAHVGAEAFLPSNRAKPGGAVQRPMGHWVPHVSPPLRDMGSPARRLRVGRTVVVALLIFFGVPMLHAADCISIQEAAQHVGETRCVKGKVVRVKLGAKGVHFLDFCKDQLACPLQSSFSDMT